MIKLIKAVLAKAAMFLDGAEVHGIYNNLAVHKVSATLSALSEMLISDWCIQINLI